MKSYLTVDFNVFAELTLMAIQVTTKLTRKEKITLQQQRKREGGGAPKVSKREKQSSVRFGKLKWTLGLTVAALGFILYFNTLHHEYALDDYSLIKENQMTRKGAAALKEIFKSSYRAGYYIPDSDTYRPFSKAMFAMEWNSAPGNASFSHFMNVFFYALTGLLLFFTLSNYMNGNMILPFVISLFYIAHPIHTEVVANIKSRDEIMSFFFVLFSLFTLHSYLTKNSKLQLIFSLGSFFLALLSKESAVTFVAIVPLTLYFFMKEMPVKKIISCTLIFGTVAVLFLLIRKNILGNITGGDVSVVDNLLVAAKSFGEKKATAVYIMGLYLKLFFFPHPLVSDYSYPQIPIIGIGDWKFLISISVYLALGVFALMKTKEKNIASFGILFFFITASIASNIFITIGTSMGERLMYLPSLGFCIAIGYCIVEFLKSSHENNFSPVSEMVKRNIKIFSVTGAILILFSFKTISRNYDWKDNYTLYSTDVKLSPNSARTHYYLGNFMTKDELLKGQTPSEQIKFLNDGIVELNKATALYPKFADAFNQLGMAYYKINGIDTSRVKKNKMLDTAAFFYSKALEINPANPTFHNNFGTALFTRGDYAGARKEFETAVKYNPAYADAYINIASVYGTLGEQFAAQEKVDAGNNNKEEEAKNFALSKQNFESAITYFKKTIECDPGFAKAYYYLGITYRNIGDEPNAQKYIAKAKELNPTLYK